MKNAFAKLFSFPRAIIYLGLASLFTDIATEMVYPLFPIYISTVLGASVFFLGLFEGMAESVASLTKLYSGYLSDQAKSEKPLVLTGYGISTIFRPLLAIATAPWHALSFRLMDRVGKGIRSSPRDAWLAASAPDDQRGKVFGFHRAMDHTGAFLGPLLATAFLYYLPGHYRTLFALTFFPGLIALYCLWAAPEPAQKKQSEAKPKFSLRELFKNLHKLNPNLKFYLILLTLFTIGNSSDAFLLLKLKNVGVPEAFIPLCWAALHLVKLSFATLGGSFSDRFGRKPSITIGWIIFVACYLGFSFLDNRTLIVLVFLAYGLYYSFTEGAEKAYIADLSHPEERGTAFGAFNLTQGIGALPASIITGALWEKFGPHFAFLFGVVMTGAALLLLFFVPAKKAV